MGQRELFNGIPTARWIAHAFSLLIPVVYLYPAIRAVAAQLRAVSSVDQQRESSDQGVDILFLVMLCTWIPAYLFDLARHIHYLRRELTGRFSAGLQAPKLVLPVYFAATETVVIKYGPAEALWPSSAWWVRLGKDVAMIALAGATSLTLPKAYWYKDDGRFDSDDERAEARRLSVAEPDGNTDAQTIAICFVASWLLALVADVCVHAAHLRRELVAGETSSALRTWKLGFAAYQAATQILVALRFAGLPLVPTEPMVWFGLDVAVVGGAVALSRFEDPDTHKDLTFASVPLRPAVASGSTPRSIRVASTSVQPRTPAPRVASTDGMLLEHYTCAPPSNQYAGAAMAAEIVACAKQAEHAAARTLPRNTVA
ncbi:hypothetical protein H9P43_002480 [Blastocladiella emersonii ATCC 22665]|nr:hypothetical protein H9P43_002480 [Blastocladiella emersonii ATCC 22665]